MEEDRRRRSMAHLQAMMDAATAEERAWSLERESGRRADQEQEGEYRFREEPYEGASDEDTKPAGVGAHGPGQGDPEAYGDEDDDGRESASEEDDKSRRRRHFGGEGHNREEANSRTEKGTEEEGDSLELWSFLRDMRTSLRGISSKQDSQHSMIVDLGNQLREETAERRRDVSAIKKRFENLKISKYSEEEAPETRTSRIATSGPIATSWRAPQAPGPTPWMASQAAEPFAEARQRQKLQEKPGRRRRGERSTSPRRAGFPSQRLHSELGRWILRSSDHPNPSFWGHLARLPDQACRTSMPWTWIRTRRSRAAKNAGGLLLPLSIL